MRLRLRNAPYGITRVIYAYLGALIVVVVVVLVDVVAGQIAASTCGDDFLCAVRGRVATSIVTGVLVVALVAWVFRLGWAWAGWMVAVTLLVVQLVVATAQLSFLSVLLIVPAIAAVVTWVRPDRDPPPWARWAHLGLIAVAAVEFALWFVIAVL